MIFTITDHKKFLLLQITYFTFSFSKCTLLSVCFPNVSKHLKMINIHSRILKYIENISLLCARFVEMLRACVGARLFALSLCMLVHAGEIMWSYWNQLLICGSLLRHAFLIFFRCAWCVCVLVYVCVRVFENLRVRVCVMYLCNNRC